MPLPSHIGRYEVVEKIGEGGMGIVYKARDPQMSRFVAIKLLKEGATEGELRERFVQEARAAGNLQNPYIVTVFELVDSHEPPYIVMEFLVGDPLDRLIRQRAPMTLVRKLELMESLCSGLHEAHAQQIVHRDIKPANLLVTASGILKILDFGLARAGASERTQLGALMGTLNYMPPEQWRGDRVDLRADVFAVGAVFYELLSYRKAFPGSQAEAMTRVLTSEPEPLALLCPDLDEEIEEIVERALRKEARARYQDLNTMRHDIARVRERLDRDALQTITHLSVPIELDALGMPGSDRGSGGKRDSDRTTTITRKIKAASAALNAGDPTTALRFAEEALLLDVQYLPAQEILRRARLAVEELRASTPPIDTPPAPVPAPAPVAAPTAIPPSRLLLSRRQLTMAFGGVGLAAAIVVGILVTRSRDADTSTASDPATVADAAVVATSPTTEGSTVSAAPSLPGSAAADRSAASGRGTLIVDALPWAEVVSIVDGSGARQALPPNQVTPLSLAVAPGDYQVTLKNGATRTVRARVQTSATAAIAPVDFGRIDAASYFRGLGW